MAVVAIGHWLGMVMVRDGDGELVTGNALDFEPSLWWITWIGQVMPLFFFVGGFASAASLLSAERKGLRPPDWVAHRLRRMMAPAVALATFWIVALALGALVGQATIVGAGAVGAAIPLWFLANYTIDIAVAPYTFRWFRRAPSRCSWCSAACSCSARSPTSSGVPVLPAGQLGARMAALPGRGLRLAAGPAAAADVGSPPWPADSGSPPSRRSPSARGRRRCSTTAGWTTARPTRRRPASCSSASPTAPPQRRSHLGSPPG